eukprot:Blabericola_migrator_1__9265@NODE_4983_length_914_cov_3_381346_g3134_i0_p2_GENE_NODE_4983_length_914_cov_3_381346_g3134_i0NODE_4983_length_914_cov_3_381346_g3134_i0_p2_ORF_typecomplete_len147_score22_82DUF5317/PF17248_2/0_056TPP_enzyme_M_2/PF16582_5/0_14_NODE_4983_length_914_cov_3_381346_g3134_i0124564
MVNGTSKTYGGSRVLVRTLIMNSGSPHRGERDILLFQKYCPSDTKATPVTKTQTTMIESWTQVPVLADVISFVRHYENKKLISHEDGLWLIGLFEKFSWTSVKAAMGTKNQQPKGDTKSSIEAAACFKTAALLFTQATEKCITTCK